MTVRRATPRRACPSLAALAALVLLIAACASPTSGNGTRVTAACPLAPVPAFGGPPGIWTCRLDEEFSGTALDAGVWTAERSARTGFHSGAECYVDDPQHVAVRGGDLVLTATRAGRPISCAGRVTDLLSGMVHTRGHVRLTYGRVEIRAELPAAHGLQPALWLYPETLAYGRWPRSGEIDVAELFGTPGAAPHLHYLAPTGRAAPGASCRIDDPGGRLHTYTLEWGPAAIRVSYDGVPCWQVTRWTPAKPLQQPAPFDRPFFVLLTLADGIGVNKPDQTTTYPARMLVDYVHIWSG